LNTYQIYESKFKNGRYSGLIRSCRTK